MNLRAVGAALAAAIGVLLSVTPAAAAQANPVQQAVDNSIAASAAMGIEQSISVVDRETGAQVAGSGGDTQYISESIVKLFTVAYYEVQADGRPTDSMTRTLRSMIVNSDDDIESSLWNVDIVPSMAARYGLTDTRNGPKTGPHDWGWEVITADDETKFLYEMSKDPMVAPLLLDAMASTARTGADGSDQFFGLNTLTGDHGSKQGWTDVGAGSSEPAEIHSVGWTDRYFVAILQTADSPDFEQMRNAATAAAQAVLAAEDAPNPETVDGPPGSPTTTASNETPPTTSEPSAVPPAAVPTTSTPDPAVGFAQLLARLHHDFDVLMADFTTIVDSW